MQLTKTHSSQARLHKIWAIFALMALCLASPIASAADYYVTDQSSSYIDFSGSGVGPGDTIYLTAHTRNRLALKNLAGTAQNPILITNTGGQFVCDNQNDDYPVMRLLNCQHVILRGVPGEGYDYGIKLTSPYRTGLYIDQTPTDIEIDSIEIGPVGGIGIQAKDEGATPPAVFDNLIVHDCYIHDTEGEGMYLGSSKFGLDGYNPQHLNNTHVYNNVVLNTGWDSIQVGCGTVNTRIHDNICIGYGSDSAKTVQNDGIRGNPGFAGKIYNNYIQSTAAAGKSGININAWNDTYVYNNVIVDAGSDGIKFLKDVGSPVTGCEAVIANNTIIEPAGDGIEYWPDTPVGLAINNIIVNPGEDYVYHRYASVDLTETTNLEAATIGSVGFVDAANDDYRLSASATGAIDQGTDVSSYGITDDIEGISRPQESYFDIGAYEYVSPIWTIITPVAWNTATGSSYCSAAGAFDDQPTWDTTNEVPIGDDAVPNEDTDTDYANRYFYIDLGTDYANIRITGTWTRYRPYSGTSNHTYTGFPTMWWDDDTDTTNDGTTETTLDWANPASVSHISAQQWVQDVDCSASPVTPQGRYLVISTGASPSSRPNEFCIVGYVIE